MTDVQSAIDNRLADAINNANYRLTLNNQKAAAFLAFNQKLIYSINGGTFKIDKELICFVNTLISREIDQIVLIDNNNNPIEIEDLNLFLESILSRYNEATFEYMTEYRNITKSRNINSMIGL